MKTSVTVMKSSQLPALEKSLKEAGKLHIRVGVFQDKAARSESGPNNAGLAAIHEFGSLTAKPPIPARSFLYMPLSTKLPLVLAKRGAEFLKKMVGRSGPVNALASIGETAEGVIKDAFATSGFGTWKANSPATVAKKGSARPLIDTAQLRKSILSRVYKGGSEA